MPRHFLYSDNKDACILELEEFDREKLKQGILDALAADPSDSITHEKESIDKTHVGNDILGFYEVNKGKPCRLILKGNKTLYKQLN